MWMLLSRQPVQVPTIKVPTATEVLMLEERPEVPLNTHMVAQLTEKDNVLRQVKYFVLHGWPEKLPNYEIKSYWNRHVELSIYRDCLLWDTKNFYSRVTTLRHCDISLRDNKAPPRTHMTWTMPQNPWSYLDMDFAGSFKRKIFLIVVDIYSKWPKVPLVPSMSSAVVVSEMKDMFSIHGLPNMNISDNGTVFASC
ncbi:hypothetical protein PR048_019824 [Dryococelus australis]|uniref:Integrase catalytic domain-containing protein n=1 Tax=Dryococelus australis TaxID=614101 RepID=A0ABQ9H4W6_9NEOP|nr:hypothetical protein PR048_019824 [Dryococelus australis]